MDTWELIDECGAALGVTPEARRKWRARGVPGKWHLALIQKAAEMERALPPDALLERPGRAA